MESMKGIKTFIFGMFGGLALTALSTIALYFSPLRQPIYHRVDPELCDIRNKLSQYQDWLTQADLNIQNTGEEASDSLQNAQGLAWQEYKKWRNHLGDLSHVHAEPTLAGFAGWGYSLRYWILSVGAALIFGLGGLVFWATKLLQRRAKKNSESRGGKLKHTYSKDSAKGSRMPFPPPKVSDRVNNKREEFPQADVKPERKSMADEETRSIEQLRPRIPDTEPVPIVTHSGLETTFMQPDASLKMEDEEFSSEDDSGRGRMPATTEIERVERRKDEVVKLARKGLTSSEISRRLRISQDQVEFIIRMRREKG